MPMGTEKGELALLRSLFDTMDVMVIVEDGQNNMIYVNQAAANSLNASREEVQGTNAMKWYPIQDVAKYLVDDIEVLKTGKAKKNIIETYTLPSGEKRWVKTNKYPITDSEGKPWLVAMCAVDVTNMMAATKVAHGL